MEFNACPYYGYWSNFQLIQKDCHDRFLSMSSFSINFENRSLLSVITDSFLIILEN